MRPVRGGRAGGAGFAHVHPGGGRQRERGACRERREGSHQSRAKSAKVDKSFGSADRAPSDALGETRVVRATRRARARSIATRTYPGAGSIPAAAAGSRSAATATPELSARTWRRARRGRRDHDYRRPSRRRGLGTGCWRERGRASRRRPRLLWPCSPFVDVAERTAARRAGGCDPEASTSIKITAPTAREKAQQAESRRRPRHKFRMCASRLARDSVWENS